MSNSTVGLVWKKSIGALVNLWPHPASQFGPPHVISSRMALHLHVIRCFSMEWRHTAQPFYLFTTFTTPILHLTTLNKAQLVSTWNLMADCNLKAILDAVRQMHLESPFSPMEDNCQWLLFCVWQDTYGREDRPSLHLSCYPCSGCLQECGGGKNHHLTSWSFSTVFFHCGFKTKNNHVAYREPHSFILKWTEMLQTAPRLTAIYFSLIQQTNKQREVKIEPPYCAWWSELILDAVATGLKGVWVLSSCPSVLTAPGWGSEGGVLWGPERRVRGDQAGALRLPEGKTGW